MPLYLYECPECHSRTEATNRMAERHTHAPVCGKNATHGQMGIRLTPNLGHVQQDCSYRCPVTRQWVTSNRQRRNIMAEHRLADARDIKPEHVQAAFDKADRQKAESRELISKLRKDLTTGHDRPIDDAQLHAMFPSPIESTT